MSRPLSLQASAEVTGRMVYVELAAFERLGRAARSMARADLAGFCSGASLAHGFRARLLEDHLPVSVGLPGPDALTLSPGPALETVLALVAPGQELADDADAAGPAVAGSAGPEERLEALLGVLYPAMLAGYEERLALASPASDAALARTLRRVRDDLATVLVEGRALLPEPADGQGGACRARCAELLRGTSPFGPLAGRPSAGPRHPAPTGSSPADPPESGA